MINSNQLMKKCIALAKKGCGKVSPNPMVGCIVLDKNDKIISCGYHHKYGDNHAERDALLKLTNGEEKGGTLIVNLEPCSHFGKTPPCADLIIERGIKKVLIGTKDNNKKVNGSGIKKLKDAGIEVVYGVLENECRELNKKFFKDVEEHKIYIGLKTATTIDGKIATKKKDSKWITSEKSRNFGKQLRKEYDAIITTSQTIIDDNPEMKHKLKIIVDTKLSTDLNSKIYKQGNIIIAIGENTNISDKKFSKNIEILKCKTKNNKIDVIDLFKKLYKMNIKSVFVEAGGTFCGTLIKNNLVDEIYHFIAPKITNDNNSLSCFNGADITKINQSKNFRISKTKKIGDEILIIYRSFNK